MDLLNDALILSKRLNFDVFNALDVLENDAFLKELKFGIGDGHLQYYLYNWRCAPAPRPCAAAPRPPHLGPWRPPPPPRAAPPPPSRLPLQVCAHQAGRGGAGAALSARRGGKGGAEGAEQAGGVGDRRWGGFGLGSGAGLGTEGLERAAVVVGGGTVENITCWRGSCRETSGGRGRYTYAATSAQ